jgi:transposase InsO family protein
LGHADVHHLAKRIIAGDDARYYLVGVIDAHTRLAWAEVARDCGALSVMFAAMRAMTVLRADYGVHFEEMLTDNGVEFCCRGGDPMRHPFERLLIEGGIRHRKTRPYRPQTNGKIERFWRTLEDEMLHGAEFASEARLREELAAYLWYYNERRPHHALAGNPPASRAPQQHHHRKNKDDKLLAN